MDFIHLSVKKIICLCIVLILCGWNNAIKATNINQSFSAKTMPNNEKATPNLKEQFVEVENLSLHYVETGKGKTVVLVHGNAGSIQDFEFGTFAHLADNYRTIAFDLPGHGSSKRKEKTMTIEAQATILHQALVEIGVKSPVLVGHSWGGAVALAYSLLYPNELGGLVLLAPAAYPDADSKSRIATLLNIPILGDLSLAIVKPLISSKVLKHELEEAFYPDKVPQDYFKLAKDEWLDREQIKNYINDEKELNQSLQKLCSKYSSLKVPTVIVTGDSDRTVSPEQNAYRLHKTIPNSKLIVLPKTGHQIPETHPEAVLQAIKVIA